MDKLKLQEEITGLKNYGEHLENQLKLLNIDICVMPDDLLLLLDKCAEIQAQSHLHEVDLIYLREFYYMHKREHIENKLIASEQEAEVKKLKDSIDEIEKDISTLDNFIKKSKKVIEDAAEQRKAADIEGKHKALLERQAKLKVPEDFNIEAIIDKLEILERHKKSETK